MRALDGQSTGADVRMACRSGAHTGPTAGLAAGYAQANLVVLPGELAGDFHEFCRRNAKPCPVLEKLQAGAFEPHQSAPGGDLRSDLPRYRVFDGGRCVDRPRSIESIWRDDFVAFLIGCSFTFEAALQEAGLPIRHIDEGRNVPMYRTGIACRPSGPFSGPLVVSMRPMTPGQADRARAITEPLHHAHGAPVHIGHAADIGIADLSRPDFGDAVTIGPDEVPVFWACGVTPLEAIVRAKPQIAITHEPGHMFVTDLSDRLVVR